MVLAWGVEPVVHAHDDVQCALCLTGAATITLRTRRSKKGCRASGVSSFPEHSSTISTWLASQGTSFGFDSAVNLIERPSTVSPSASALIASTNARGHCRIRADARR